jgi:DNA polymerase elongation subunit (family B)
MAVFIDVECYKDYFLFCAKNSKSGKITKIPMHSDCELNEKLLREILKVELISFNGNKYDLPIISGALAGWDCQELHDLSNQIILSDKPTYQILKDKDLTVKNYNHIDLIEVAIGVASLKIYGGRLHTQKMQDLPIDPQSSISPEQREILELYCQNDLELTELLYNKLLPQINLRREMKATYGMDLRSKSDAQIAETIIKSELNAITNDTYSPTDYAEGFVFNYKDPLIISFKNPELVNIYNSLLEQEFTLSAKGSVQMPTWLARQKIKIGNTIYKMGIGGLHSCEKSQLVKASSAYLISDFDVTSFYPSIILQQELYPENMGKNFLTLYQSIVDRRVAAKRDKNTVEADVLKIVLNGSYGKFGSRFSALYSPELLLQTTITGQLSLLMLIESLEENNIQVVSANTDGIVTKYRAEDSELVQKLLAEWTLKTTYNLEQTDYRIIASRDVNNYLAVKTDGKTKGKGCFADPSLSKNPDGQIIYEAVIAKIASGKPISQTIKKCTDITKFVTVRTVTGGAMWQDKYLGKAIRFYHTSIPELKEVTITYAKNGNKVPLSLGCMPLMDLPDTFPTDINYDYYIMKANELLIGVGYA